MNIASLTDRLINLYIVVEEAHPLGDQVALPYVAIGDLRASARELWDLGVKACKLFVYVPNKSEDASYGLAEDTLMVRAIRELKAAAPDLVVMSEVCACAYASNGECILLNADGSAIDDEATHAYVGEMACLHAEAVCDVVVAGLTHRDSVAAMRQALDARGFKEVEVMASIQFRSHYYAPYRAMMETEPEAGETFRSHLDPADPAAALKMLKQFEQEGAEQFTVQPAMPNIDHLIRIADSTDRPVSAYSVSTELACFSGADRRLRPEKSGAAVEYYVSLLRTGADSVMTYLAADVARYLEQRC